MEYDDNFWKAYFFGTSYEMDNYLKKEVLPNGSEYIQQEDHKANLVFLSEGVMGILAAPIFGLDFLVRIYHNLADEKNKSIEGTLFHMTMKPGIIGTFREYSQKHK